MQVGNRQKLLTVKDGLKLTRIYVQLGWTRNHEKACDKDGVEIPYALEGAVKWTLKGAAERAYMPSWFKGNYPLYDLITALENEMPAGQQDITAWNNAPERTRADVVSLIEKAIENIDGCLSDEAVAEVADLLKAAKGYVKLGWIQEWLACDKRCEPVSSASRLAVKWGIRGALYRAACDYEKVDLFWFSLNMLDKLLPIDIDEWHDDPERTKEDVLALLDMGIPISPVVKDGLVAALNLLKRGYTKYEWVVDANDNPVPIGDENAAKWSVDGSLMAIRTHPYGAMSFAVKRTLPHKDYIPNTQEEVIALMEMVIANYGKPCSEYTKYSYLRRM